MACLSMTVDADTIHNRQFLNFTLPAPHTNLPSFSFKAVDRESLIARPT
jgi:hypothetical protein